ncbi:hypothetical protein Afil01_14210 [Actinorhabdospora filicis]|uniref:Alpha/beta hydrolase n=1 Tax=Actinorhabdospora filicis TaxID=1785913 RepID=A0A9W6SJA8_9ACTN|nr:hypothetical protein [Actinorhabdospora filicis]GLZ76614.1 hypothetical protein Afil01_14210 [Actinorhabdospora filicis]
MTALAATPWTGLIPVGDTAPAATDTGGPGVPVVHLNGQFATRGYWKNVIAELGPGFRHLAISAKVAGTHGTILRKDAPAIAAAVREVAA